MSEWDYCPWVFIAKDILGSRFLNICAGKWKRGRGNLGPSLSAQRKNNKSVGGIFH